MRGSKAAGAGGRPHGPAERYPRLDRLLAAAIVRGAIAGVAATALLVLNVDLFLGASLRRDLRFAIGVVLLANGVPLVASVWARAVLADRLAGSAGTRATRRRRAKQRLVGWLVPLVAVVWVAAGLFELIRATVGSGG